MSNRTLNEATFGYLRQDGHAEDPTPDSPTITAVGNGVVGFGVELWHPIEFTQHNFQFKDTVTLNRGRHSFRTGGELRVGRDGATLHHWERPNYTFQSILDFIDDEAFTETRAVDSSTGLSTRAYGNYITNEWALFFQDNWKVRSNLTLNLGLRYENFGNPKKDQIPFNGIILGPAVHGRSKSERRRSERSTGYTRPIGTTSRRASASRGIRQLVRRRSVSVALESRCRDELQRQRGPPAVEQ
jgi:outer membrane receptor protein involved in Fe transport